MPRLLVWMSFWDDILDSWTFYAFCVMSFRAVSSISVVLLRMVTKIKDIGNSTVLLSRSPRPPPRGVANEACRMLPSADEGSRVMQCSFADVGTELLH